MEDLPVFLPSEQGFIYVELSGDGLVPGVYQFYDDSVLRDVIKMTTPLLPESVIADPALSQLLYDGESLRIVRKDLEIEALQRTWMSASHRMALAVPLHPDHMSETDWQSLPGVGSVLAKRIINNRQKNGNFDHLENLIRVKGIGKKRVESWKKFFSEV